MEYAEQASKIGQIRLRQIFIANNDHRQKIWL